jgi:REP element-mobilizing transposase RayT
MPQSLAQVIIHIVFSTKNRAPLITGAIEPELYSYLGGICNNQKCPVILINGVSDHIHILCGMSRTLTIADLLEEIKTHSSKWIKTKSPDLSKFSWQNGYGVFSVDWRNTDKVKAYISAQKEHHAKVTFQDEYRQILREYGVQFDERYVWD